MSRRTAARSSRSPAPTQAVDRLLDRDANPNARGEAVAPDRAAFRAWNGDLRMVRMLIAAGADPAARDEEHDATPSGWAETSAEITKNLACAEVAEFLRNPT
jgi:hypothetical protein